MKSRTQQALEWLKANPEKTPYAASKQFKISASAVLRAIQRREGKEICPHCNQIIRNKGGQP